MAEMKNWQNHGGRPLTPSELDEIRSKVSGYHFMKEQLGDIEMQLLYCAEALLREVEVAYDFAKMGEYCYQCSVCGLTYPASQTYQADDRICIPCGIKNGWLMTT